MNFNNYCKLLFQLPVLITFLLISLSQSATGTDSIEFFKKADPLVLKFKQNKTQLFDGILGYSMNNTLFLPIEEFSNGIGFAITVDITKRRAEGFYLTPNNKFYLDMNTGTVKSAGQSFNIETKAVVVGERDLYIAMPSLNHWFKNVSFEFNKNYLFVEVRSNPLLPETQRKMRKKSYNNISINQKHQDKLDLPEVIAEYKSFRLPSIDVNISSNWSEDNYLSTYASLRGTHDILGLGAEWFVSLDQDQIPQNARIIFSRKDSKKKILRPFNFSEIKAGDIGQTSVPLISKGQRGMGISFTDWTRDVIRGTTTELRGELLEGWEAELYYNNILLAFDAEPEKGEYVFPDIPLHPGINKLKIVLHGPQGQREETIKNIKLGGNQPAPGKFYTNTSILMQNKETIPVQKWFYNDDYTHPDLNKISYDFHCILGVRPGFSLSASGVSMSIDGERYNFAGLSAEFPNLVANLALDDSMHMALGGRFITNLFGTGILLQHKEFQNGFRSPVNLSDGKITKQHSEIRINQNYNIPYIKLPLSTMLRTKYEKFFNAEPEIESEFGISTSASIGSIKINNRFNGSFKNNYYKTLYFDHIDGKLDISFKNKFISLRKKINYIIQPEHKLESFSINTIIPFAQDKVKVNMKLDHNFTSKTSIGLGMEWKLKKGDFFTQFNYDMETEKVSANIGMRFSMNWLNGKALPSINRKLTSSKGFIKANVFIDKNGDGLNSLGDEPLSGISFKPGSHENKSNDKGFIILDSITPFIPTNVILREETLPDPFLRPSVAGYKVMIRPGTSVDLSFPVIWMSDIEGTVLVTETQTTQNGSLIRKTRRGLGNVKIIVMDKNGKKVRSTRSEFDGFFAVQSLPSGKYKLIIDPDQAARFHLDDNGGTEFTLKNNSFVLFGVELNLTAIKPIIVKEKTVK